MSKSCATKTFNPSERDRLFLALDSIGVDDDFADLVDGLPC